MKRYEIGDYKMEFRGLKYTFSISNFRGRLWLQVKRDGVVYVEQKLLDPPTIDTVEFYLRESLRNN